MSDLISRKQAVDALIKWYGCEPTDIGAFENIIEKFPSAQPEIHFDEWCVDCKEYDHDKHCCPRFNKVIRRTVEELKEGD